MNERKVIPFKRPSSCRLVYGDGSLTSSATTASASETALGKVDRAYEVALSTWVDSSLSDRAAEISCYVRKATARVAERTIESQRNVISTWPWEKVIEMLKTSTSKEWEETPIFYRALVEHFRANRC
jgi:hypothetical protein